MGPLTATRFLRQPKPPETLHDPLPAPTVRPLWIGPLLVDPPILQAPMAGFTNYAFRQIVREFGGAGLLATEMVNAKGFVWLAEHEAEHPDRLWGVADEPRPLAVQMWDNDPATLAKVGARLAHEYKVSVVDINFGCPVRDVVQKAHSGSYLLREPERMGAIIEQVVKACAPTPVTAKIRLGCSREQHQRDRDRPGGRRGRRGGAHGSRPNGGRYVSRLGRLGPHRGDQAAPEADSADRQRRPRFAAEGRRCVSPVRHRRRDDRPGVAGQAVAVSAGGSGAARRAGAARADAGGRAATAAASLRSDLPSGSATRRARC